MEHHVLCRRAPVDCVLRAIVVSKLRFDLGIEVDSVKILLASSIVLYVKNACGDRAELPRLSQLSGEIHNDRQRQTETQTETEGERDRRTSSFDTLLASNVVLQA